MIQGYAINEKRLNQKEQEVQILKDGIRILSRAIETKMGDADLTLLDQFAKGLELLDDYDHEKLNPKGITPARRSIWSYLITEISLRV
ncbi:hypothetical protein [Dyadobacter sp. 32]|uniref:hypothetical protein n=1 Tax=Dyadobacter sp. 32 TaxID=538966 RepID=UPI0039C71C6E